MPAIKTDRFRFNYNSISCNIIDHILIYTARQPVLLAI